MLEGGEGAARPTATLGQPVRRVRLIAVRREVSRDARPDTANAGAGAGQFSEHLRVRGDHGDVHHQVSEATAVRVIRANPGPWPASPCLPYSYHRSKRYLQKREAANHTAEVRLARDPLLIGGL